ncbi:hypothetical protein Q8A67_024848 [Cirrhinus molitorella]|uniref:Uncharacterized protein n=1 Tax=Cirrhinus molitorella TaxID=172907 RepID=A0AA88NZ77_9TELE|nr:hypothetical protein Q8A67_024848 [Cirrhinus molitorella]
MKYILPMRDKINTAYVSIFALPHSRVHVLASGDVSNCGEFCFELVLNAPVLRSRRSAGCLLQLFLRGFCADHLEPKQKEKLRSISGRSASLWFRAAVSSPSRSSQPPQQQSRGVRELHDSRDALIPIRFFIFPQASGCSGRLHGVSSDDTSVQSSGIWGMVTAVRQPKERRLAGAVQT